MIGIVVPCDGGFVVRLYIEGETTGAPYDEAGPFDDQLDAELALDRSLGWADGAV